MTAGPVEAMFHLLFGHAPEGYSTLNFRSQWAKSNRLERHAFPLDEPNAWISAVVAATAMNMEVLAWPFVFGPRVLRGIGSWAHSVEGGHCARGWQRVLVVRWPDHPTRDAADRFTQVGGHLLIRGESEHLGVLRLAEDRHVGGFVVLGRDVAQQLGASPYLLWRSLPVPGAGNTHFVTDPARVHTVPPATDDVLVEAGLRPSSPRWSL